MKCFTGLDLCPVRGISNESEQHCSVPVFQETTFTADLFFSRVFFPCEIMSALSHLQSPFVSRSINNSNCTGTLVK